MPVPAPAMMSSGFAGDCAASRCRWFSFSNASIAPTGAIMGPYCMFLQYPRFWYDLVIPFTGVAMGAAVKKTISLPAELAREAEAVAKAEGKTLSAVIQDALRQARVGRRDQELRGIQGYWSRTARERGILTEQDLERYLRA